MPIEQLGGNALSHAMRASRPAQVAHEGESGAQQSDKPSSTQRANTVEEHNPLSPSANKQRALVGEQPVRCGLA